MERAYIKSVRVSWFKGSFMSSWFWVFLTSSLPFCLVCRFLCILLILRLFLFDDILALFVGFWSFSCASRDLEFEIQTLCFLLSMDSSRGRLRNQVVNTLVWYVMSHWHADVWIWIQGISVVLPLFLFCVENRVSLSRGVHVACATWREAMRIVAGVGDLVQRTVDGQAQVRYSVAGWSIGRVTPWAICTMHMEMRSAVFLVLPQNQGRQFPNLGLKTSSSGSVICASKSMQRFLGLGLKTKRVSVFRLRHKNDVARSARDTCRDLARLPSFRLGSCSVYGSIFTLRALARDW
jgi:hypothetical protein